MTALSVAREVHPRAQDARTIPDSISSKNCKNYNVAVRGETPHLESNQKTLP